MRSPLTRERCIDVLMLKSKSLLYSLLYGLLIGAGACSSTAAINAVEEKKKETNEGEKKNGGEDKILEAPRDVCGEFSEPGRYKVKPRDTFFGRLGVHFQVTAVNNYDQIVGNYINTAGSILKAEEIFAVEGWGIAHYGLKLYAESGGVMVVTSNPKDLYDRCLKFLHDSPDSDPVNHCSLVSPTEELAGEVVVKSIEGYFGKTNVLTYAKLAECAAKDVDSIVAHTSRFLELPPLDKGLSYMYIFKDKVPQETGLTVFSTSAWFYKKDDFEIINYEVDECNKKIESGNFAKGDHELTHVFVRDFHMPFTFNEGFANYVPVLLRMDNLEGGNSAGEKWNTEESMCKEDGFQKGYGVHPYIKYYNDPMTFDSYRSGECFWQKLVHDYDIAIIPKLMNIFKENVGNNKTFEEILQQADIDTTKYQPWGLGE